MQYHIEDVERQVIGYDEYIADFKAAAKEYCHSVARELLQSVFNEFDPDVKCGVYLDCEQTVLGYPVSFEFNFLVDDGKPLVFYMGVK